MTASIICFPGHTAGAHDLGTVPGRERVIAEAIALRLVEVDPDLAGSLSRILRDGGRLLDEIEPALDRVLGPEVKPGPFTAAVQRAFDDDRGTA